MSTRQAGTSFLLLCLENLIRNCTQKVIKKKSCYFIFVGIVPVFISRRHLCTFERSLKEVVGHARHIQATILLLEQKMELSSPIAIVCHGLKLPLHITAEAPLSALKSAIAKNGMGVTSRP